MDKVTEHMRRALYGGVELGTDVATIRSRCGLDSDPGWENYEELEAYALIYGIRAIERYGGYRIADYAKYAHWMTFDMIMAEVDGAPVNLLNWYQGNYGINAHYWQMYDHVGDDMDKVAEARHIWYMDEASDVVFAAKMDKEIKDMLDKGIIVAKEDNHD